MTGFVYAMLSIDGRAKIGWSADPMRRLAKVNSDTAVPVKLAGLIPATKKQETEILELLKPWRIHRSWYRVDGPVAAFVEMLPRPEPRASGWSLGASNGHPLQNYRRIAKRTLDHLGIELGVSKATISRIENRKMGVSLSLALRIQKATGGAVTPRDLIITSEAAA